MGSKGAVDRLDEVAADQSGSKMVATSGGEPSKLWSWREESNLQPVVYKDKNSQTTETVKAANNRRNVALMQCVWLVRFCMRLRLIASCVAPVRLHFWLHRNEKETAQ